ncbi:MAG: type IV secretion system DNA-binding domain-containing protein, partial [Clostridia bacterium]|nr:type IV secretion system DNA-binding domain-containing protein [Clostridia bacterium]
SFKSFIIKDKKEKQTSITPNIPNLLIGLDAITNDKIFVPESGLYQNFLITGTIGSGKTSSAMYPFTKQLIEFNSNNLNSKISLLILDVKGNYFKQVKNYTDNFNLSDDLIVISLNSDVFYNPLHKPELKPQVLASRLKTILLLFSENNSESYWLDKAEQIICECIKLCRLYNDGYVTFLELHKLITVPDYYTSKINYLRNLFTNANFSHEQIYDLNTSLEFFEKEFLNLDARTKGILISEITRITNTFISDYQVMKFFCPPKDKLTFNGFSEVLRSGKIVVLNMNIFEYNMLSRIIATYLKLDFQTEVMTNLSNNTIHTSAFICDEYDKFASKTDGEFFSLSREAKCINILSIQSYSSLKATLKDESIVKVIIQNLINKIWFRTDDSFTIEEAQKQLGKEEKEKISKSISENAKETRFNYITNTLNSENSSISETYNSYSQNEFIFETNFFTRELKTFTALTFLSDGNKIYTPKKTNMIPYFGAI